MLIDRMAEMVGGDASLIDRWGATGLLTNLDADKVGWMAQLLEWEFSYLADAGLEDGLVSVALPLVRRVFAPFDVGAVSTRLEAVTTGVSFPVALLHNMRSPVMKEGQLDELQFVADISGRLQAFLSAVTPIAVGGPPLIFTTRDDTIHVGCPCVRVFDKG